MSQINESISSEVFHFTTIDNALSLVSSKEPKIILSVGGEADARANKDCFGIDRSNGQKYYWSLTRNYSSKIGYVNSQNKMGERGGLWGSSNALLVRFEIDGDVLNTRYKGGPVCALNAMYANSKDRAENPSRGKPSTKLADSYGINTDWVNNRGRVPANGVPVKHDRNTTVNRQLISQNSETEDRLISNTPTIPNPQNFIKRIDIYVPPFCWYEVVPQIGDDLRKGGAVTVDSVASARATATSNGPQYIVIDKGGKKTVLKKFASLTQRAITGNETGSAVRRSRGVIMANDTKNFGEAAIMDIIRKVQKMLKSPVWGDRIFVYQDISAYNTYASRGMSGEGAEQSLNGIAQRMAFYRSQFEVSHDDINAVNATPENNVADTDKSSVHFRLGDIRSLAKLLFWLCYTAPSKQMALAENYEDEYRTKGALNKATIAKMQQASIAKAQKKSNLKAANAAALQNDVIDSNRADVEATKKNITSILPRLGLKNQKITVEDMGGTRGRGAKASRQYTEDLYSAILGEVDKLKMGQVHMTAYFSHAKKVYQSLQSQFGGAKSAIKHAILSLIRTFGFAFNIIMSNNKAKCFSYHGWSDRRGRKRTVAINEDDIREMVEECLERVFNESSIKIME